MKPYQHRVQYYETDMMGITHHANYIRWMEEARIDFLEQLGFPYARMESAGILSPVRSVTCAYRHPSTFGENIAIDVSVKDFNGVVLTIGYLMRNQKQELICEASSEHVFVNREGRIVRLKREQPEFCRAIDAILQGTGEHNGEAD
ncbi:MAG: acyl-CoA thioesterase [Clostridia bacterium]|nr:acyl-CoA thioesterase [Clostridia bacterium]